MEFKEFLKNELNEQTFSIKDVSNEKLSKETGELGISIINSMENDVNVYVRWSLFSDEQTKDSVKNYVRIFNELAKNLQNYAKLLEKDYK